MNKFIAKYLNIKLDIIDSIENGELIMGKIIPSEREIMEKYKVSRITVRKAMDELVNEGYLERIQGKGTYVKDGILFHKIELKNKLEEDLYELSDKQKIVNKQIRNLDKFKQAELNLSPEDTVFNINKVLLKNKIPVVYISSDLPTNFFEGIDNLDFSKDSLYKIIQENYNLNHIKTDYALKACNANEKIAKHLQVSIKTPVLQIDAISYTLVDGVYIPVMLFKYYYRSNTYKFLIKNTEN